MSMKVHPSHTDDVSAARSAQAASTHAVKTSAKADKATRSFAALLATQSTTTAPGTDVATTTTTAAKTTAERHPDIKLFKGEAMTHVTGHSYAEIDGGKRDGMFVNTTHNKRRGMAFVRVERNGREYHIYGSGKDRLVVACKPHRHSTTPTTTTTDAGAGTGGVTPTVSKTS